VKIHGVRCPENERVSFEQKRLFWKSGNHETEASNECMRTVLSKKGVFQRKTPFSFLLRETKRVSAMALIRPDVTHILMCYLAADESG